jgi:ABC-type transport system involved in multi-copper enzyme maturation permease subunit
MQPQLRSELIKLASTRTIYGLTVGAVAVVALSTWSTISSAGATNITGELHAQQFFFLASVNLALFAVIVGIRAATDEFRHGTVVPSVFASRNRARLLAAKATVAAAAAAVLAALAQAAMVGLAMLLAGGRLLPGTAADSSLEVSSTSWAAMGGLTAASAVWAALGVGIGALVRHQVAAIVGAIIWVLVVENLGAGLLGEAGRYLPGQAAHAVAQIPDLLTAPVAAAVLAGYAAAVLLAARLTLSRRDI